MDLKLYFQIFITSYFVWQSFAAPKRYRKDTVAVPENGVALSTIKSRELNEVSGIAASRRHGDIIYMINDSGATNRLYAVDARTGETKATFKVRGAVNCDWEDLAIGPGPNGGTYIYIGDIGGNAWSSCLTIYRVLEPDVITDTDIDVHASFRFSWPEENCETLMVDTAGDLYLVSKTQPGNVVKSYKVPPNAWGSSDKVPLTDGQTVNIELEPNAEGPVAGDISPTGQEILLKTYNNIYRYNVSMGQTIQSAMQNEKNKLFYNVEQQGESIAWDKSANGFYTVSEGYFQTIWYYSTAIDYSPPNNVGHNHRASGLLLIVLAFASVLR